MTDPSRSNNRRTRSLFRGKFAGVLILGALAGCGGGGGGGGPAPQPTAAPDTYAVNSGGSLTINAPGVLANDSGSGLTAQLVSGPPTLTLNPNGSFTYTGGTATSFTYQAVNGTGSSTANVTININQPPVANAACNLIHDNDGSVAVTLTGSDPNGGTLTYSIVTQPTNGTVTPASNTTGLFNYQPNACSGTSCDPLNRRGMDKFTFRVTDPGGLFSETTAWILNNGKLRIMPLGDSITAGFPGLNAGPDYYASYRQKLFIDLNTASPGRITFVGSNTDGIKVSQNPPWDLSHEGHEGWCSTSYIARPCSTGLGNGIAQNIQQWLNSNPADVVLLHIGTNDLSDGRSDSFGVESILDQIDFWAASNHPVTVFVAKIIKDVPNYSQDLLVTAFNSNVATMISARPAPNRVVFPVDMQAGAGLIYGDGAPGADMADNLHPTASGYNKMADQWKAALTTPASPAKFLGIPSCP